MLTDIFKNPVDVITFPVYRDESEFSLIFPEIPVGLASMPPQVVRSFLADCTSIVGESFGGHASQTVIMLHF